MIFRKEYRACLKQEMDQAQFSAALKASEASVKKLIRDGVLLTASLYTYRGMCFLYYEALQEALYPQQFLKELEAFMEQWPEEDGRTAWVFMYPIYWHRLPEQADDWEAARDVPKKRIGRIAFVYPEKLFSYTYWHQAIVEEGLLQGDQYQFISLHENILFSYFEEPKHMVNIRNIEESSKVIDEWLAVDPESHFDREKAGGENFRIIPALFSIGRRDIL